VQGANQKLGSQRIARALHEPASDGITGKNGTCSGRESGYSGDRWLSNDGGQLVVEANLDSARQSTGAVTRGRKI
jgi:hypothetical protein